MDIFIWNEKEFEPYILILVVFLFGPDVNYD